MKKYSNICTNKQTIIDKYIITLYEYMKSRGKSGKRHRIDTNIKKANIFHRRNKAQLII